MARFDVKVVNETWTVTRDAAGRKLAAGKDGDRDVKVFMSDIKGPDGLYPIMEKYMLPYVVPVLKDGVIESKSTIWITRAQFNELCGDLAVPLKAASGIQVSQIAGKVIAQALTILRQQGKETGAVGEDLLDDILRTVLGEMPQIIASFKF